MHNLSQDTVPTKYSRIIHPLAIRNPRMEEKLHQKMEDRRLSAVFSIHHALIICSGPWICSEGQPGLLQKMAIKNRKRAGAFALILGSALATLILLVPKAVKAGSETDEAATARHEYTEKIAAKYNYRFGKELPFVPSNAMTDTGEFIDPKNFPDRRVLRSLSSGELTSNGASPPTPMPIASPITSKMSRCSTTPKELNSPATARVVMTPSPS